MNYTRPSSFTICIVILKLINLNGCGRLCHHILFQTHAGILLQSVQIVTASVVPPRQPLRFLTKRLGPWKTVNDWSVALEKIQAG